MCALASLNADKRSEALEKVQKENKNVSETGERREVHCSRGIPLTLTFFQPRGTTCCFSKPKLDFCDRQCDLSSVKVKQFKQFRTPRM